VVYRGALEKHCGLIGHRGFESHPLRLDQGHPKTGVLFYLPNRYKYEFFVIINSWFIDVVLRFPAPGRQRDPSYSCCSMKLLISSSSKPTGRTSHASRMKDTI
jgi:hypothetical protein